MKHKIESILPIGYPKKKVIKTMVFLETIAILYSFSFFFHLSTDLQDPQTMQSVLAIIGNSIILFPIGALICMGMMIVFYRYHYLGSKSIYLMKRLPKHHELWKRVCLVPITSAMFMLVSALLVFVMYYGIYILVVPQGDQL